MIAQPTSNLSLMLAHHMRRWHSFEPTLAKCHVFGCLRGLMMSVVFLTTKAMRREAPYVGSMLCLRLSALFSVR